MAAPKDLEPGNLQKKTIGINQPNIEVPSVKNGIDGVGKPQIIAPMELKRYNPKLPTVKGAIKASSSGILASPTRMNLPKVNSAKMKAPTIEAPDLDSPKMAMTMNK